MTFSRGFGQRSGFASRSRSAAASRRQEELPAQSGGNHAGIQDFSTQPQSISPQTISRLQRSIGNRRTAQILKQQQTAPISRMNQPAVQRAIGLEFEVSDWKVQHPDGKKLVKGTETVINQDGVRLTADDDGERSDIEWVTTALESKDEVLYVMDNAASLAEAMLAQKDTNPLPAQNFASFGTPHADAEFIPSGNMKAHMQATIGVPLGNIASLYEAMSSASGPQSDYAKNTQKRAAAAGLIKMGNVNVSVSAPPVPVEEMSDALKGFLMLVIDYLRSGYTGDYNVHAQFPKAQFALMAKTSFKRMLDLVKDEADLTEQDTEKMGLVLKDEWINWLIEAAIPNTNDQNIDQQRQKRLLNHEFGITGNVPEENETPYTVDVTREDWLRNMPQEDMMRLDNPAQLVTEKGTDNKLALSDKLEGFAALGNKTDKLVTDVSNIMAQEITQKVSNSTDKQEEDLNDEDSMESVPDSPQEETEPIEMDKGKEQEQKPHDPNDPNTNAAVFEMRQLEIEGGEPHTWADNALTAWNIYEQAIGNQVYRAGNREEIEGDTTGYANKPRPQKQVPQQVNQVQQVQNNAVVPQQRGFKAKAKRAWRAIKRIFGK